MPKHLKGLKVEEFAHSDDKAALKSLQRIRSIDKITSKLADVGTTLDFRMIAIGNCVRITPENSPRIYRILEEVCNILSYDTVPEIYSTRSYVLDIQPSGAEKPGLVVSDLVLNNHNDDLLYFNFGRAITRLKSGSLKFYIAARTLLIATSRIAGLSDATKLAFANWMRKSELTADRGGLLTCQDINVAMTFLMNKAGIPLDVAEKVNYVDYVEACGMDRDNALVKMGMTIQTFSNCTGWANDRIVELFNWHTGGDFYNLLERYED